MAQVPAFLTTAPAPDRQHQPLAGGAAAALDIHASGEQQHAIRHGLLWIAVAGCFVLAPLGQAIAGELAADGVFPRLTKHGVVKGLHRVGVTLAHGVQGLGVLAHQHGPVGRRAVAVGGPDVEAHQPRLLAHRRGAPLAALHHPSLLAVRDRLGAVLAAVVAGVLALADHLLPAQHLHGLAERAGHIEPPLIATQEGFFRLATGENGGSALADLAVPVVVRPVAAQLDRVAFVELGVGVHLVKQHHLSALAPEAPAAGGVHDVDQAAVAELLQQDRVAGGAAGLAL